MANAEDGGFDLNSVIKTDSSDPEEVGQEQEEMMYEKARQKNPELDEQAYSRAMGYVKQIKRIHRVKNKKAYEMARLFTEMKEEKIYEDLGYDSWNEYASDDDVCPVGRSTAYRYIQVGKFMDEQDVGSRDFDDRFYEEHDVDREIEYNDDDTIDQEATRKANQITARVRFMDMRKIASVHNDGHVNAAEARELMAKAITQNSDDFDKTIKEVEGEENPSNPDDDLFYEGLKGTNLVIPLGDIEDDDQVERNINEVKSTLRSLLEAAEDGTLKEEVQNLRNESDDVEKIASKSTTYHKSPGGRYFGDA